MMSRRISFVFLLLSLFSLSAIATEKLVPTNLPTHVIQLQTIPSSPADIYTKSVWVKAITLIPQSNTNPTCTIQDKTPTTPVILYNVVALTANHTYHDAPPVPLYALNGITWSCSDTTVMAQLAVMY